MKTLTVLMIGFNW